MEAGEGVDVSWYVSCREIPLNPSPHLLLWEFPILAALTENQMRCCTLNLSQEYQSIVNASLDISVTRNENLVRLTIYSRWRPISSVNLIIIDCIEN